MVQYYNEVPDFILPWIPEQHFFFVASAPLTPTGHVNVSPKCMRGTFHIVSPNKIWYEDLTGSGSETIAHMRENGRITIMFVAMSGPPRILRLYGKGTVHELGTPEYQEYFPPGTRAPGSRAAIVVDISLVGTSCGFSVPNFAFAGERDLLHRYAQTKEAVDLEHYTSSSSDPVTSTSSVLVVPEAEDISRNPSGLLEYWAKHAKSLDGLPSVTSCFKLPFVPESAPERRVAPLKAAAKKETVDEVLKRSVDLENAQKVLPAVGASLTQTTVSGTTKIARDANRDRWNIIVGFVIGLFAAATVDRLAVFLRSHV